jgi:hypothetical protein
VDDSQNLRLDPRSNVFLGAVLYAGSKSCPVRIRNLSASGALIDGPNLPNDGAKVRLQRGSVCAVGEVAWKRENLAGIRFAEPISVPEWVKPAGHAGQRRVDMVVAAVRDDLTAGAKPESTMGAEDPPSLKLLSQELQQICQTVTDLPNISVELAEAVARIDAVAQALLTLSRKS